MVVCACVAVRVTVRPMVEVVFLAVENGTVEVRVTVVAVGAVLVRTVDAEGGVEELEDGRVV